jgi:DNA-binding response OmpR family regulator
MKDEEVKKLLEERENLIKRLDEFLSKNKGKWFTAEELARELGSNEFDVSEAFIELMYRSINMILGKYECVSLGFMKPRIYRKVW